jgi:hypothetical protein
MPFIVSLSFLSSLSYFEVLLPFKVFSESVIGFCLKLIHSISLFILMMAIPVIPISNNSLSDKKNGITNQIFIDNCLQTLSSE